MYRALPAGSKVIFPSLLSESATLTGVGIRAENDSRRDDIFSAKDNDGYEELPLNGAVHSE